MNKFTNPLENIKIASPCRADWNEMIGSERRRFCGECQLNVYNLSGMSRDEAENLLLNAEGRVCVRFYKRADGSVLTQDCPVGWRAIKRRVSKTATAFASLIIGLLSGLGLNAYFNQQNQTEVGKITVKDLESNSNTNIPIQGKPVSVMGNIAIMGAPLPVYEVEGQISKPNLKEIRSQIKINRKR